MLRLCMRMTVLISLRIIIAFILSHRIVLDMMEDQVMILICMDMKGM